VLNFLANCEAKVAYPILMSVDQNLPTTDDHHSYFQSNCERFTHFECIDNAILVCHQKSDAPPLRIVLYQFIQGRSGQVDQVNTTMMRSIGEELGKIHKHSTTMPHQLKKALPSFPMGLVAIELFLKEIETPSSSSSQTYQASLTFTNEQKAFVTFLSQRAAYFCQLFEQADLPRGIIHGDLFPDNALFSVENDQRLGVVKAIVDWEEVCLGEFVLDLGMTICGCCFPNKEENKLDMKLSQALLDGYQKVMTSFSQKENQLLLEMVEFSCISIAFWRFRQFVVREPKAGHQDKYKEMMVRIKSLPKTFN